MYYVMSCRRMCSVPVERVGEKLFVQLEYLCLLELISFIGPYVTRPCHTRTQSTHCLNPYKNVHIFVRVYRPKDIS